jgi:putative pyoverdin transport system ATP-binding/permease protein
MMLGRRYFIRARVSLDGLQESIHGLLNGIKELKLSDKKRIDFFESVLMSYENEVRHNSKSGHTVVTAASNYGDLLSFFVIGSIMFIFINYRVISTPELIGVIMALLYITTPISVLLNSVPEISMARVSMQRVSELFKTMPNEGISEEQDDPRPWERVRFDRVSYRYMDTGDDDGFGIGPLDLEFRKGEITFVVGGNGSGKSTLCKLLTLHYRASDGVIYFGDHAITDQSIGSYRQSISAIYSDYHLFEQILGMADEGLEATVDHYLAALDLKRKVTYCNGKFSTLSLSSGQRRRMALLASIIEDKELYVFDEWAADQDPAFKTVFYDGILPALKARGKAVIAITHDDRYFHLADQLIVLSEGQVLRIDRQSPGAAYASSKVHDQALWSVRSTHPHGAVPTESE